MKGDALFDKRIKWLLARTDQDTRGARSFRSCLQLIIALQRPEFAHLTLDLKKVEVAKEGFRISVIKKYTQKLQVVQAVFEERCRWMKCRQPPLSTGIRKRIAVKPQARQIPLPHGIPVAMCAPCPNGEPL
jgi:hypothetical protein